ncbi:hypothetical protein FB451DRAFT_1549483 [Mycena latifolia]|nr:hypothetical protein FB451DRAFT_1549483 [Mycena latifolia]
MSPRWNPSLALSPTAPSSLGARAQSHLFRRIFLDAIIPDGLADLISGSPHLLGYVRMLHFRDAETFIPLAGIRREWSPIHTVSFGRLSLNGGRWDSVTQPICTVSSRAVARDLSASSSSAVILRSIRRPWRQKQPAIVSDDADPRVHACGLPCLRCLGAERPVCPLNSTAMERIRRTTSTRSSLQSFLLRGRLDRPVLRLRTDHHALDFDAVGRTHGEGGVSRSLFPPSFPKRPALLRTVENALVGIHERRSWPSNSMLKMT